MAGLVCHKFAGTTGQLIARAARVIKMANLLTVPRITCKILILLALAVAIPMPFHPQTGAAGRSPTSVVQSLLGSRPKLARTGLVEMNQDC